jgi:hypothetical protein
VWSEYTREWAMQYSAGRFNPKAPIVTLDMVKHVCLSTLHARYFVNVIVNKIGIIPV